MRGIVKNYFITLRKFKITLWHLEVLKLHLEVQKVQKIGYCDLSRLKYYKIFKHEILHLKLLRVDWKELKRVGVRLFFRNGGKYGFDDYSRSEVNTKINSSRPDVIGSCGSDVGDLTITAHSMM